MPFKVTPRNSMNSSMTKLKVLSIERGTIDENSISNSDIQEALTFRLDLMHNFFKAADDRFIKTMRNNVKDGDLDTYKYFAHPLIAADSPVIRNELPIQFRATPDTLLNLAAKVVDAIPLPSVYTWTNFDVCNWIKKYGYPHYQNTFRVNLINGRRLLLLDASALSAMNIKNFDDIKHIAHGIRGLFFFELTKFTRSISLAPHFHYELYKLFRIKNGTKYSRTRRTDLWRQIQLLREKNPNLSHWELLESWLALEPDPKHTELFGEVRRYKLYQCPTKRSITPPPAITDEPAECNCMPPCECYWTERDILPPWRFKCLPQDHTPANKTRTCKFCVPPCICNWTPKDFEAGGTLSFLQEVYPHKYGAQIFEQTSKSRENSFPRLNINLEARNINYEWNSLSKYKF